MSCITAKSTYALLALVDLVEQYGKGVVSIRDIVDKRGIPQPYLEQILTRLAKGGIVRSVRGFRGGYRLSGDPKSITLLNVIEKLEGDVGLADVDAVPVLKKIFDGIESRLRKELGMSLAEFARRHNESVNPHHR
jgi:Rrf2 family protein